MSAVGYNIISICVGGFRSVGTSTVRKQPITAQRSSSVENRSLIAEEMYRQHFVILRRCLSMKDKNAKFRVRTASAQNRCEQRMIRATELRPKVRHSENIS